ncbi:MAG: hypothetical protein HYV13_01215 [Candidatus Doudnabacteria bacterium]|nr:hypothetical protein [Candidatus Doudnabacteria bacterium]
MINIEKTSGLPIEVTPEYKLKFNPPLREFPLTFARKFSEMVPVLLNPNITAPAEETYFVYRGIHMPEHQQILRAHHLTYDITVIPSFMLGEEFNHTVGHYHAPKPGTNNIAHPEVYEVLHGEALVLLQKMDQNFEKTINVLAVKARTGEKVIYPPNYGHIMINIGSEVLVVANWLSTDYKPLYEPVTQRHGMAYYPVKDEVEGFKFVPNGNYKDTPALRMIDTKFMTLFAVTANRPMYLTGTDDPQSLDFLNNPEKYAVELSGITS